MGPGTSSLVALALVSLCVGPAVGSGSSTRFDRTDALPAGPVDWVTVSAERLAFGSGSRVVLGRAGPPLFVESEMRVDRPLVDGVLAVDLLYVAGRYGGLGVVDLAAGQAAFAEQPLSPPASGALRLAQMDDYLVVAEDGYGVRVLRIPPRGHPPVAGMQHAHHGEQLVGVGLLPLPLDFDAVATSGRTIFAAVAETGVAVIDARDPATPVLVRIIPFDGEVADLGASGGALYLLMSSALVKLHPSREERQAVEHFADLAGQALSVVGRRLLVGLAGEGLAGWFDSTPTGATFNVSVGNNFFDPLELAIVAGDTVTWNKPNTGLTAHNVFSCNAAQQGCAGQTANESFVSGTATSLPFTFSHTFQSAGNNPYVCQTHAFLASMQGAITVSAPPPPPVPALTVGKLNAGGSSLGLDWDAATCGSTAHHVIFGLDTDLPASPGNTYGLAGGVCGVGAPAFVWNGVPPVAPNRFLWFLILANEGTSVEGSWGHDSFGGERNGAGPGGSSGQCGIASKNLASACGL